MVRLLDSTLREGEQTPGVYFDPHIKLAVAELLDAVGLDFVEAGHPSVGPEIRATVERVAGAGLRATVAAHARSLKEDVQAALDCDVGMIGIFFCVSERRLSGVFRMQLDEAIDRITTVIGYAKAERPDLLVRYTPEDTVRSEFKNVVRAMLAAVRAGADIVSVADTTGAMVPGSPNNLHDYITRLKSELSQAGLSPRIAVHCHNDRGLALANALDAVRAGVDIVDVSVLGLGERAGIVDMASMMSMLQIDLGQAERFELARLPELYSLVSDYSGVPIPVHFPIVGKNAFTHCAGVHSQAAIENPLHYQSLDPAHFGRAAEICLDHMSGSAALDQALARIGAAHLAAETRKRLLAEVKTIGQKGRTVDLKELAHLVSFLAPLRGRKLEAV